MGQVKIQGVTTCMYLCMDICGIPYASREFTDECVFNETIEEHNYNTYSSAKYSNSRRTLYLGMTKHGQLRRVQIRSGSLLGKLSTYTRVLTRSVDPSDSKLIKLGKTVCLPTNGSSNISNNNNDRSTSVQPRCRITKIMRQRKNRRRKKKRPPPTLSSSSSCINKDVGSEQPQQKCHHETVNIINNNGFNRMNNNHNNNNDSSKVISEEQHKHHHHHHHLQHHRRIPPPLRRKCDEGDGGCILRRLLIERKRKSRLENVRQGVRVRHRKHRTAVRLKEEEDEEELFQQHLLPQHEEQDDEDEDDDVTMTTEDEMILDDQSELFLYQNGNE